MGNLVIQELAAFQVIAGIAVFQAIAINMQQPVPILILL